LETRKTQSKIIFGTHERDGECLALNGSIVWAVGREGLSGSPSYSHTWLNHPGNTFSIDLGEVFSAFSGVYCLLAV